MKRIVIMMSAALALTGCAPMVTQSPDGALTPVNAVADGADTRVMLAGADVVAYFTEGRHRQGDPAIRSVVEGVTFRFASAGNKALFDKDPQRYQPQYGGY
jgi:hypothetical protein